MKVVNIRKAELQKRGYDDLQDWKSRENHLYIGREMSFRVPGATSSKWRNRFSVKKYGLEEALRLYEEYVRENLWDDLHELKGMTLGCWCKPNDCHGDVLVRLYREKYPRASSRH